MQKIRKSVSSTTLSSVKRAPIALPDIVNVDDMSVFSDDELGARCRMLEDDRQKVVNSDFDPKPWEEEIAYVKREMQIRYERREAHARYVKQLDREFSESEASLPQADLDNTNFLRAIGELN